MGDEEQPGPVGEASTRRLAAQSLIVERRGDRLVLELDMGEALGLDGGVELLLCRPIGRLVVVDGRTKRSGDYIEQIGYYDPRETTEENLRLDVERANHWLATGAQPTDTALRLLQKFEGVELPAKLQAKRRSPYVKRQEAQA